MPFIIRKNKRGKYDIVRKNPNGSTTKVGESSTREKAKASARIRQSKDNK